MSDTLKARIGHLVRQVLDTDKGAWMVWCDPRGDWLPLLKQVAVGEGGFTLVCIAERTSGHIGGPRARREMQARIAAGESFVLHVPAPSDALGWLWAQALLAERIYATPLRQQLVEWGWRPHKLTISDDELAQIARRNVDRDPVDWGGAGLQPDVPALLEVLAAGAAPDPDQRLILDLTVDQAGLPAVDEANLERWRASCLARLLVAQAYSIAPDLVPAAHELLVPAAQRPLALRVLDSWADSLRFGKGLPDAVVLADRICQLGPVVAAAGPGRDPFMSHAAESAVFGAACAALAVLAGRDLLEAVARLGPRAERHAAGFWGRNLSDSRAIPWAELHRLSHAARDLLDASPKNDWASPDAAIDWYVAGGWRMDQAGEDLMRTLDRPVPGLLALIEPLRAAYRARWEATMLRWSEVWEGAGCPVPSLGTAGEWAAGVLREPRPTAILLLDALRYDLGASIVDIVNRQEGAERATVVPARAPLPSITVLGMGAALPIPERDLEADVVDGRWQLRHRAGQDLADLSSAASRRAWLRDNVGVREDSVLSLAAALSGAVPPAQPGRTRLVIADDAIDKLGHEDQLELQGTEGTLEHYAKAVARLRDSGWLRILMVTDHGFIHWPSSEEKSVPPPLPEPAYASRRAAAYPSDAPVSGPSGLAPGGRWRVAVPRGVSSFRAYGGLGYFHGGASLQEWIIPCIKVEWPREARPVDVEIEPLAQVLGARPKVTLLVVRASLLGEESIPRTVDVVIRDASANTILFRSEPITITPDRDRLAVVATAVEGVTAERGTALRIEVRDKRDDEPIASGQSVLMSEIAGW